MEHQARLVRWAQEIGITLTEGQVASLIIFHQELQRWNAKTNLTSLRTEEDIFIKHFVDSLACAKALQGNDNGRLVDIGTGAGFPGLPLKVYRPSLDLTLIEPSVKKVAFLHHIIGTLQLSHVRVARETVETYTARAPEAIRYDVAITRALNVEGYANHVTRLLSDDGILVLCRATPAGTHSPLPRFEIVREIVYELPAGYGTRALTVLRPLFHLEH